MISKPFISLSVIAATFICHTLRADDDPSNDQEDSASRELAGKIVVQAVDPRPARNAELHAVPLINYSDPQRNFHDSALWMWELDGRPLMFAKLERIVEDGEFQGWQFCCASATVDQVQLRLPDGVKWTSSEAGTDWKQLPDLPAPAASANVRLTQMKRLSRGIDAVIIATFGEDREKMRLLPRPLHRYDAPAAGIVDGAIFALTSNGTNPDSLIIWEAVRSDDASPKFRLAIVGMTGDAVSVSTGDHEVWSKSATAGPGDHKSWLWHVSPE